MEQLNIPSALRMCIRAPCTIHAASKGDVLEKHLLDRIMPPDRFIPFTFEEHELAVCEGSLLRRSVDDVHRIETHECH